MYGIWGHEDAAHLTYFGLRALQHRGQQGSGIVANNNGQLKGDRGLGLVAEVFTEERQLARLAGTSAIGHVRYATVGRGNIDNVQPLLFRFTDKQLALTHEGNLTNARTLRTELESQGAIFRSDSDTEILMHLIRRSSAETFMGQLKDALRQVRGGFAYLLLTEDGMYAALDPAGSTPLALGQTPSGAYVVASETCALETTGAKFIRDIKPGEVVQVNDEGYSVEHFTQDTAPGVCPMEFIYFARPDSNIAGVNVHAARKRMGARLARESPVEADMVIGVPNSSISAGIGYAEESGIPNEMGLVKNQYVTRTFIQPTQELREQGVRMKLSAVRGVVEGKRVIMVDDSIVRGTTSRRIVKLLRDAGATEVHVRIAAPPLRYPTFLGVGMQNRDELISAEHTPNEVREIIGADSLEFLTKEGFVEAVDLGLDAPNAGVQTTIFDGHYPEHMYDFQEKVDEQKVKL